MLGPLTNSVHMKYKLYIRDLKFLTGFSKCDNVLVRSCFSLISNNANSILGNKLAYFRDRFAININNNNNNNNNNCLKSNIQCIEIRVQWTVHLSVV